MAESDEECELAHLVPADDVKDITPPSSPAINKVPATPSSPTSVKFPSSSGGSFSSKNFNKSSIAPSITPVPGSANSRFLYVNTKFPNLSRRPSLLSDSSSRTPKEAVINTRMTNMKKEPDTALTIEPDNIVAPPNTPDPSSIDGGTRVEPVECESYQLGSTSSSHVTTMAMASESDTISEEKGSSETLRTGSGAAHVWPEFFNFPPRGNRPLPPMNLRNGNSAFIRSFLAARSHQQRNVQHHSFISDTTDVRQMENALLQLLEDFHSGKLRAFAKDCSMEQMQGIREQQERLARLHFDLGARQELYAPLSDEGLRANQENMRHLMSSLQQLSMSIEKLQLFSMSIEKLQLFSRDLNQ